MKNSPYNIHDSYILEYNDSESSLERSDISESLNSSGVVHTVLEGETLQNISFKYYGTSGRWGDIASLNNLIDPFDIEKGDTLLIPE